MCLCWKKRGGYGSERLWNGKTRQGKTSSWPSAIKSTSGNNTSLYWSQNKKRKYKREILRMRQIMSKSAGLNWKLKREIKALMANKQHVWLSRVFELLVWLQHKDESFHVWTVVSLITSTPVGTSTIFVPRDCTHTHLLSRCVYVCVLDNQFWQDQTFKNPDTHRPAAALMFKRCTLPQKRVKTWIKPLELRRSLSQLKRKTRDEQLISWM